jgi:hypothetical protein
VHGYTDHVSILKFIERNWRLGPLTARSRDNLPNPHPNRDNLYVPVNGPAIGDLFDMFDFGLAARMRLATIAGLARFSSVVNCQQYSVGGVIPLHHVAEVPARLGALWLPGAARH